MLVAASVQEAGYDTISHTSLRPVLLSTTPQKDDNELAEKKLMKLAVQYVYHTVNNAV